MAFPTFLMGCLPTYQQVGSLSTFLLIICRLFQGMSVGGQLPASLIYTVEMVSFVLNHVNSTCFDTLTLNKNCTSFYYRDHKNIGDFMEPWS